MPDTRPLRPGDPERLGDYRLIGLLGEGGQGIVYLGERVGAGDSDAGSGGDADTGSRHATQDGAEDGPDGTDASAGDTGGDESEGTDKPPGLFAIKLLRTHLSSDPRARRYFAKEVAAAQRIDPSFTARIVEADVEGRAPYIVSEYVDGRSLSEVVRANGPMSGAELRELALGTLNALIAIHRANVVHRDLKPSNVLLGADRPRVIDFGIARALDSTISVSSGVVGTPAYMAPEQLTGQQVTPAVDVFAWAATMVYAATGAPPFGQDSIPVVMHGILNADPAIGAIQSPLRELVWYCLYKNPAQRPTASQVLDRLTEPAVVTPAPGFPPPAPVAGPWGAQAQPHVPASPQAYPQPHPTPGPSNAWSTDPNTPATDPARQRAQLPPNQPGPQQAAMQQPALQRPAQSAAQQAPPQQFAWTPPPGSAATRPPSRPQGRRWLPAVAAAAGVILVAGVVIVAVQMSRPDDPPDPGPVKPAANAAITKVVNPSHGGGGTLKLLQSSDFDSLDPGVMYLSNSWNFSRLYARPLLTYKSVPGTDGLRPAPDLATGLGEPSEDLKTWTYRLRKGIRFDDGTPVTAKDVRYAVARTFADTLVGGPGYFRELLEAGGYAGPFKDKNLEDFTGVTAQDDQTVVFHLKKPYADFDYLAAMPQTAPVPAAKDTGQSYRNRPVSTGPYKIEQYAEGKSVTLARNPQWSSDPNRTQLPDRIEVAIMTSTDTLDQQLLSGQADLDLTSLGLQQTAAARVQGDPNLRRNSDNTTTGYLRYLALSTKVAPFDDRHCRLAVQYAMDRADLRNTLGAAVAEPATNVLPPVIVGRQRSEPYPESITKAKEELVACGKPSGFSTRLAIRKDRPKDRTIADQVVKSLRRVGINAEVREYPVTGFYTEYAGKPEFVHKNGIGMTVSVWGADFPTGLGFLSLLVDGRRIPDTGNSNLAEINDSGINELLDRAAETKDQATREGLSAELDRKVMENGAMVPLVYDKVVLYRNPRLANIYVNQMFGGYDVAALGIT